MDLNNLIKGVSNKIPLPISKEEDVALCSRNIQEDICPVFEVSNKSGQGLEYFRYFLNLLPINPSNQWNINQNDHAEF